MREHGLLMVLGVQDYKKNENNNGSRGEGGGGTLKTEELEINRSNESAGGPDKLGVQGNKTRGYLVSGSTRANTPVTRG